MKSTDMRMLVSARFRGDIDLLTAIRQDKLLAEEQRRADVLRSKSRMRMRLLGGAMRVSDGLLPAISDSLRLIAGRVDVGKPLEAFVFSEGEVNAFVCETSSRFLVGLSSGAVTTLSVQELEFVIGHELGHALFGHTEVAAGYLVENDRVSGDHMKLLRAWQRASEISADRVGLLCCGDLEVAATALVKTLAGLPLGGQKLRLEDVSTQWEALLEEVMDEGALDLWEHSHPFPPLRIQALRAFWNDYQAGRSTNGDPEVRRLLGVMDAPGTRSGGGVSEGILSRFLLWGGLFVGTADGPLAPGVKERLEALTVFGVDLDRILSSGVDVAAHALEQFRAARASRRTKLRAPELMSLMRQLVAFAALDDVFTEHERIRLGILAGELGLPERSIELLIEQHQQGQRS